MFNYRAEFFARVERSWVSRDRYDVWCWQYRPNDKAVFLYPSESGEWTEVETAAGYENSLPPKPSLSIPGALLKEIAKEFMQGNPPDKQMQHHLDDAVKVRDRLLSLIETREGGLK